MDNLTNKDNFIAPTAEIYTLYDDDGYVIAAVTMGENEGTSSNYVYVTSKNVNREALSDGDNWTWTREVFAEKEIRELSEVGSSLEWIGNSLASGNMQQGEWYEVKYDANGNVRKVESLAAKLTDTTNTDGFIDEVDDVDAAVVAKDTVVLADTTTVTKLTFKNGTLYTNTAATEGFAVSPDAAILLALADKKGAEFDDTDVYTGYTGLEKALRDMNGVANYGTMADGTSYVEVSAILENGVATSIVINDKTPAGTAGTPSVPGTTDSMGVTVNTRALTVDAKFLDGTSPIAMRQAIANALVNAGVEVLALDGNATTPPSYAIDSDGRYYMINITEYYSVTVDDEVVDYVLNTGSATANVTVNLSAYTKGSGYIISQDNGSTYTYAVYNTPITADSTVIDDHFIIKTGYVKAPLVSSITGATGTPTITVNYKNDRTTGYILVDDTAEITIAYGASDLAGATDVTFNEAVGANTVTVSAAEATAGKDVKLSYKATADVTSLTVKETAVVSPTPFSASVVPTDTHGLTVAIYNAPAQAKAGETVTVTVAISGAIDDGTAATLTLSTGGNWVTTQVPVGFNRTSGTVLTSDSDANFGSDIVYAQFTFLKTAGSDTVTVTVE